MRGFIFTTLLCLGGCKALSGDVSVSGGATPIVRAVDGGSASVTITACPRTLEGAAGLKAFLDEMVNYPSEMAVARNGGNARLNLNLCPDAGLNMTPLPQSHPQKQF